MFRGSSNVINLDIILTSIESLRVQSPDPWLEILSFHYETDNSVLTEDLGPRRRALDC